MNIKDPEKYLNSFWDWTEFNDCFDDTGIRISDIDGIVSFGGKFLLIETKGRSLSFSDIPKGQLRLFKDLVKTGLFVVYVVYGRKNKPERMHVIKLIKGKPAQRKRKCTSMTALKRQIDHWYKWAKANKD